MDCVRLLVCENESNGLPDVRLLAGELSSTQLAVIRAFVRKNLERLLTLSSGRHVTVVDPNSSNSDKAITLRVTLDRKTNKRYPRIFLESDCPSDAPATKQPSTAASPVPTSQCDWSAMLLDDLTGHLQRCSVDGEGTVNAVLDDMRAAAKKNPDKFALILFWGYLQAGEAACSPLTAPHSTIYKQAEGLFAAAFATDLPAGLFDENIEHASPLREPSSGEPPA